MSNIKTVHVPHLGGIDAAYQMPCAFDDCKPTLVLINSFTTTSDLFQKQFKNERLTNTMNLLAIEPLGHGQTRTKTLHFTYWDTAIMNLQVIDALGINGRIFALGTAQGGWLAVRMALLAPEKICGVIPLGTSMDYESERTRLLGCWDAPTILTPFIEKWTTRTPTPAFTPGPDYTDILISQGFGELPPAERDFWTQEVEKNYHGDNGRQRIRVSMINLRDRDGLQPRLFDINCPVLWMQGTEDKSFSVANAEEEIRLFVNSKEAKLNVVEGGQHFLNWSNPKEVDQALLKFVRKWS